MENQITDVDESENICEEFICCVCMDLLYKPIVLSCGHISCFWCIHNSMSGVNLSHCPICRHPYNHFPTVCQMLYMVLMKMYPIAYKRRENQTLEVENKKKVFSPQFDILASSLSPNRESNNSSEYQNCKENNEMNKAVCCSKEEDLPLNNLHGNQKILLADVLCVACNQMLFHPVVLNCGHVYCETCISIPKEGKLTCQVCQTMHPNGSPKVCLELDRFLEQEFPEEYALKKAVIQQKKACLQHESPPSCSTEASKIPSQLSSSTPENASWWSDQQSKIHSGVGCDCCGMYPIVGDRYRCKDCVEIIGFDLCKDCYNTRSKLPGRFNQQHTSEHQFQLIRSSMMHYIMSRLANNTNNNASAASFLSGIDSEELQAEINLIIQNASNDAESDHNDDDTPPAT